jgi:hypothetical protein
MPSQARQVQGHKALEQGEEIPFLQRSVSVPCRAEVIIAWAPSTLRTCETHAPHFVENPITGLSFGFTDTFSASAHPSSGAS